MRTRTLLVLLAIARLVSGAQVARRGRRMRAVFRRRRMPSAHYLAASLLLVACDAPNPPDIVLVSLDAVRADHLSLYGYSRETSRHLSSFARGCRVFEQSLSSSTWTLPSHATMLTGVLPIEHGLISHRHRLPESLPTVAELLRESGYSTSAVTDGGFLAPAWGLERGFERFKFTPGQVLEPKDAQRIFASAGEELHRLRQNDPPFLLFVHSYEAHQPYDNREGFATPYLDPQYEGRHSTSATSNYRAGENTSAEDARRMVDLYDGEIRRLDHYLGAFLAQVATPIRGRTTWTIITSDHGEAFGEHGTFEHGMGRVEDENIRVPMLLCGPSLRAQRLQAQSSTLDVTPTVLDIGGTQPRINLLGRSLRTITDHDDRWVVSQGFNSHPELNEEWLRIQHADDRLIVDLGRRRLVEAAVTSDAARERALAVLARGRGADQTVVLPGALGAVTWMPSEDFRVARVIDDVGWRPKRVARGARSLRLDPAARAILLLRRTPALPTSLLRIEIVGQRLIASPAERGRSGAENPLEGKGSLVLLPIDGGFSGATGVSPLTREAIRELTALGYL